MRDEQLNKITPDEEFLALGAKPVEFATETPSISSMESALIGAQQGATMGFADELAGATGAGIDLAMAGLHNISPESFQPSPSQVDAELISKGFKGDLKPSTVDIYRELRDTARQREKQATSEHPIATGAGALGGALLTGKAVGNLGNLTAPAAEGAGYLETAVKGAANTIPMAIAASAGLSEAPTTEKLFEDIAQGTAIAAPLGGAASLAGKGISEGVKSIKNSQFLQDLIDSYQTTKKGVKLEKPEILKETRDKLKEQSGQIYSGLKKQVKDLFNEKSQILSDLEKKNANADISPILDNFKKDISSSVAMSDDEKDVLVKVLDSFSKSNTYDPMMQQVKQQTLQSPLEIEKTLKTFKDLKSKIETPSGMDAVDAAVDQLKQIQNNMSPEIQNINNKLFQVIENSEALTGQNILDYQGLKGVQSIKDKLADQLEKSGATKQESFFDQLLSKGGQTSKEAKVGSLKEISPEVAKTLEQAIDTSKITNLAKKVQEPILQDLQLDRPFSSVSKMSQKGAAKIGSSLAREQIKAEDFLSKGNQALNKLSGERLTNLADKMLTSSNSIARTFGNVLSNLTNKSDQSKNAMIFTLMQQPEFRKLFNDPDSEFYQLLSSED